MIPTIHLCTKKYRFLIVLVVAFCVIGNTYANRNIKFSVDMSLLVSQSKFNPATDAVYIRGSFNNWGTGNMMTKGIGNVYSAVISLADNSSAYFKYFINSAGADNGGWEKDFPNIADRNINITVNDLNLPTVYFNDGNMNQSKSTAHFDFYYTSQENTIIEDYAAKLENHFERITTALQATVGSRISIYIYPTLDLFHLANGYPEQPSWATGTAWGKSLIKVVSPTQVGYDGAVDVLIHEFTHTVEAWKTQVSLPAWLNEGVACYYGRNTPESYGGQTSFRQYIQSLITQSGKPFIINVFGGNDGYGWSTTAAYFIAMTKGEAALAKFVEKMNYADIGYPDLGTFQNAWWTWLDQFVATQTKVNVKFSVDMTEMIQKGYFVPGTNHVFVRGGFNDWGTTALNAESGNIYSATVPMSRYYFVEYKFYTDNASAPNSGWEKEFSTNFKYSTNRLITVGGSDLTLDPVAFSFDVPVVIADLDMQRINNKIKVLRLHSKIYNNPGFETFKYPFKQITAAEYQAQKPADAFDFDAGFVAADGTINISEPSTDEQKAIFANLTDVAMYYLCQSYMFYFYQTRSLPLVFKTGFPLFEAGLLPADNVIQTALNAYGGSFSSFDVLNDKNSFIANKGVYVAGAFAEFMNAFKNWGYPFITGISASGFNVASWWFNVNDLKGLLDDFNRYTNARFLQADDNLRIKMYESPHFRFYTRPCDYALNFPTFQNTVEAAYQEYSTNFDVEPAEKLSFFTLPESVDADIEGTVSGGRITGGTAWSSGVHSTCAATAEQLSLFYHQNRHELGHAFQNNFPAGENTAWSNEGFPSFIDLYPLDDSFLSSKRQQLTDALNVATQYFGHRPTYEETRVYPSNPYWDYYSLGVALNYYLYKRGGFQLLKAVQMNDLAAYQSMGYATAQAFLDDFYFDFDIHVLQKPIVTLTNPKTGNNESGSTVDIAWTPLKSDVKLNVFVSTDNGTNWTKVADHITTTSCNWNPNGYTGAFKIKISAPELLNISGTFGPFNIIDLDEITLLSPQAGNYIIANDTATITWGQTKVNNLKIEYSADGGNLWNTITNSTPSAAGFYNWITTSTPTSHCRIRIADASNPALNSVTGDITVLKSNNVGGPYLMDKNTVALLHFDNGLQNRSNQTPTALGDTKYIGFDASLPADLGNCLATQAPVMLPPAAALNLTGDWTLEAWVKFTSFTSDYMYLFYKPGDTDPYQSNYSLAISPWWGNVFFGFYFSALNNRIGVTSVTPSLNQWYHVAFIRDTKQSTVSVVVHDQDRKLVSTASMPYTGTAMLTNAQNLQIGTGLAGYIDEVRISNVVRSFINTGADEIADTRQISVYPNPGSESIHVNLPAGVSEGQILIFDMSGRTVATFSLTGTNHQTLDVSQLNRGIYMLQLRCNKTILTEKVILK